MNTKVEIRFKKETIRQNIINSLAEFNITTSSIIYNSERGEDFAFWDVRVVGTKRNIDSFLSYNDDWSFSSCPFTQLKA